jgi:hypothetical protein
VHPWESGMDNSPSWDQPLSGVPEATNVHLVRRDVVTVSAEQRPSTREYRQYLGIVEALRTAGWDTERQPADSPFAVEDPAFTAITIRAAVELASAAEAAGLDATPLRGLAERMRAGLGALWDDLHRQTAVGPATSSGLVALHALDAGPDDARLRRMLARLDAWANVLRRGIPTADPEDPSFDPIRYWRGPVWVLINWLVADGLGRMGGPAASARSGALRAATRSLVEQGFSEYYDPRTGDGIGGHGFSWSAALTLAWLTT